MIKNYQKPKTIEVNESDEECEFAREECDDAHKDEELFRELEKML